MTANVTFTVAEEENVLKIANAALRYQPADERMSEQQSLMASSTPRAGSPAEGPKGPSKMMEKVENSPKSGAPTEIAQEASSSQGGTAKSGSPRKIHFPPTEVSRPRWSTVWTLDQDGELAPHRVKLGITNGRETAVLGGELSEGAMIVTGEYLNGDEVGARSPFGGPFGSRRPRRQQRRRR